jgi:hypothetical protein
VQRISWNTQLTLVGFGYLAVLAISTLLVFVRHEAYAQHAADAAAYSGMWAGGDLMLELFIVGMFLVMTFFLVLVIAKSETAYTTYSKALLAVSLTAPLSVGLIAIPAIGQGNSILGWACMFRLFASPLVTFGIGASRLFAWFPRPKKLTVYALVIEGITLVLLAASLFFGGHSG